MNELKLLTPSNILSFIGFCIAAFAFLSQYLSFPKDILSELMRTSRINPGELPIVDSIDCTNTFDEEFNEKSANDHIKTFFIEHDTVSYITLLYIVFSIFVLLTLLIHIVYFKDSKDIFSFIIPGFSTSYCLILSCYLGNELQHPTKKLPEQFKSQKKIFLYLLLSYNILLAILMWLIPILKEISLTIPILIFGISIHFFIMLSLIGKHQPVNKLLFIWERLHKNAIKVNNLKNKEEE